MLALKSWGIDLLQSEKKTLYSFLGLYSFLSIVILAFICLLYYNFEKDLMLQSKRPLLQKYADELIYELKQLHINFDKQRTYPRFEEFDSAIFDSSKKRIFSTMPDAEIDLNSILYVRGEHIYFIDQPESYYLGSQYVVLRIKDDGTWRQAVLGDILLYGSLAFGFMLFVGYFLLRLFLKPMNEALHLLDRFIKDTTHELNTPVNAIISNVEMIESEPLEPKLQKRIKRIDIGAKTISNLYQDLTYLTLGHRLLSQDEPVDIPALLQERLEYFQTLLEAKKLTLHVDLRPATLQIDRVKFAKLIDNLLSNAIKYNRVKGSITVSSDKHRISIADSGRGMEKAQIDRMFERFSRFDSSVGGFGIGLSIVSMIAKEYGIAIEIDSTPKKGTKVTLSW